MKNYIIEVVIEDADGNIFADIQIDSKTGRLLDVPPKYSSQLVIAALEGALATASKLNEKTTSS